MPAKLKLSMGKRRVGLTSVTASAGCWRVGWTLVSHSGAELWHATATAPCMTSLGTLIRKEHDTHVGHGPHQPNLATNAMTPAQTVHPIPVTHDASHAIMRCMAPPRRVACRHTTWPPSSPAPHGGPHSCQTLGRRTPPRAGRTPHWARASRTSA